MDHPPIVGKTLTKVGTPLVRLAKNLAADAQRVGIPSKYRILNGFILRGIKMHNRYVGQVIDTPALVLLAGTGQGVLNELVGVGNRDDFAPPGTNSSHSVAGSIGGDRTIAPVPPVPNDLVVIPSPPATLYVQAQPQLYNQLWLMGKRQIPLSAVGGFNLLDRFDTLTYATEITVGNCVTVVRDAIATYGSPVQLYNANYMALNSFWIGETDLPSGWSAMPRRLVDQTSYAPSDNYGVEYLPRALLLGCSVIPAADASGEDQYCLAFEAVHQNRSTWTGAGYTYYDRQGEHALVIARGSLARSSYTEGDTAPLRATTDSVTLIRTTDIPMPEIQPFPTSYTGKASGPTLDMFSWFLAPHVVRYTDGFATFCVYWGSNYRFSVFGDGPEDGLEGQQLAYAILVVDNNNDVSVLKADRNDTPQPVTPIPTADATKLVVPWIVGAVSVEREVSGDVTQTAYCLVWEQWQVRKSFVHPGGSTTTELWPNSAELGGRWALYTLESGAPTRTELDYTCAPLFSPNMNLPETFPTRLSFSSGSGREWWYAPDTSYSSLYQMAPEKLVTACIPTGYFRTYAPLNPSTGQLLSGLSKVDPHQVSCAVFDLTTNTFEVRGVIATREWADQFCHITVVQQEVPATDTSELLPAVLLATMRIAVRSSLLDQPPDKTYLSIDGGTTWREYIEDAAGGNGTFLIGNRLWALDANGRFDTNPFGN